MNEEQVQYETVTLIDDNGGEHDFSLVDLVLYNDNHYALLLPSEPEAEEPSEDVLVLRVEGESLVVIEDEDEFNGLVAALTAMTSEVQEEAVN